MSLRQRWRPATAQKRVRRLILSMRKQCDAVSLGRDVKAATLHFNIWYDYKETHYLVIFSQLAFISVYIKLNIFIHEKIANKTLFLVLSLSVKNLTHPWWIKKEMSTLFALDTSNFIKILVFKYRSIISYLKMNKNSGRIVYCNLIFYNSFVSQFVTFDFRFLLLMSFLCLIKWLQRNDLYTIRKVFKQALKWYITLSIPKIFYLWKMRSNHAQFLLLLGIEEGNWYRPLLNW